jgi:hypothetical protein
MTQNNSISMKTVVETYIIEETQELIYDNEKLDQWNKHVDALGLKGQKTICKPEKSPIPFLHMKNALVMTFEMLCPRKVLLTEYGKTPIPVEILDLAALSVKEQYFNKIEIWYDEQSPDPACIGYTGSYDVVDNNYKTVGSFNTQEDADAHKDSSTDFRYMHFNETGKYLIGRWADVKASLEELTARAKSIFVEKRTGLLQQEIRDAQRKIEDVEQEAKAAFGYTPGSAVTFLPF